MNHQHNPGRNPADQRNQRLADLCANLHDDDGPPPKQTGRHHQRDHRKTQQLCAQAARAAGLALSGAADDALRELYVLHCQPWPNAKRLRVTVTAPHTAALPDDLPHRLRAAEPYVRAAVASGIHRKRAPAIELVFEPTTEDDEQQGGDPCP